MFQGTYDRVSKNARSKRFVLRDFQLALKPLVESWKPSKKLQEYDNVDWHVVLVQLAREFWRKPMLFYSDVPRKEYLENIMIAESIVMDVVYRHMVDDASAIEESDTSDSSDSDKSESGSDSDTESKSSHIIESLPTIEPIMTIEKPEAEPENDTCWPQTVIKKGADEMTVAVCQNMPTHVEHKDTIKTIPKIVDDDFDIDGDIDIPDFDSTNRASDKGNERDSGKPTTKSISKPPIVLAPTKDYLKYYPTYKSTNMYLKRLHNKT